MSPDRGPGRVSGVIGKAAYAARVSEKIAYGVLGVKFGPAGSPAGR